MKVCHRAVRHAWAAGRVPESSGVAAGAARVDDAIAQALARHLDAARAECVVNSHQLSLPLAFWLSVEPYPFNQPR